MCLSANQFLEEIVIIVKFFKLFLYFYLKCDEWVPIPFMKVVEFMFFLTKTVILLTFIFGQILFKCTVWSKRVTLSWEFSSVCCQLLSSFLNRVINKIPFHKKHSKKRLFRKNRELICKIKDWNFWKPIRAPFRHDHVIIDSQSKATLVYNRRFVALP